MSERSLFIAALQIDNAAERPAYLAQACGDDFALRQRVEALLAAHVEARSFLASPAVARQLLATVDPIAEGPGIIIGCYKLLEQIGEGGFGVVFMAEQTEPLRRKVAIKVIKPGMDSRQMVARFEAERQALALMNHPNIAHVFDGGTTSAGRPYFVMELVRGAPITDYCDRIRLTIPERVRLFIDVCQAVQHAHQKGVIHRDIKPSNVLVTLYDGQPVVKVIDFGIAKALGQQLTEKTLFTNFARMIGTPLYMPPEQAQMSGRDVDTRADIYSLGVLLYELLTGTTPFAQERLSKVDYDEMRRIIREEEPPKPSDRMSTVAEATTTASEKRQADPRKLGRLFRGEMDWVVMKALEKDRDRRYETANALAADLERYLHDEAVLAYPPSAWYRFGKFARRKKATLAVAACALLALSGTAGSLGWAMRDRAARAESFSRQFAARDRQATKERQARDAALDAEVTHALEEAGELIEVGNWPAALAAVEHADKLLSAAGRTQRPPRLRELQKELRIALRLEEAYLGPQVRKSRMLLASKGIGAELTSRWQVAEEAFFWGRDQDAAFTSLFLELGIDVAKLDADEAVERLRGASTRLALLRALDEWSALRRRARGDYDPVWKLLLDIASRADDNPWRSELRIALLKRDRKKLEELAETAPVRDLAPATVWLLGHTLQELGSLPRAMRVLREGQRSHPDDLWLNDALAYFSMDFLQPPRYDDALRYYSMALALRPRSGRFHLAVANLLMKKGEVDEALAHYAFVRELDPQDAQTRYNLGKALREHGRKEEAVAEFQESIRLKPDDALVHNDLGVALYHVGRKDEALAAYRKAIGVWAEFPLPYCNLGHILREQGKLDEAVTAYRESARLDPSNIGASEGLRLALRAQGKPDEAHVDMGGRIDIDSARKRLKPIGVFANGLRSSFSSDGTKLVIDSGTRKRELYLCDIATNRWSSLTAGRDPAFRPTGDLIAFVRNEGEAEEIWLISPDGKNEQKVADGGFPGWSGDGKSLYYNARHEHCVKAVDIAVPYADAEASFVTRIAEREMLRRTQAVAPREVFKTQDWYPAVSPDGRQVAYVAPGRVNIIEIDGGKTVSQPLPGAAGGFVGWSPDGRRLAYGGYGVTENAGLWMFDVASGEARQIIVGPFTMPSWSPDGKRICFYFRPRFESSEVWVVDAANLDPFATE